MGIGLAFVLIETQDSFAFELILSRFYGRSFHETVGTCGGSVSWRKAIKLSKVEVTSVENISFRPAHYFLSPGNVTPLFCSKWGDAKKNI